VYGLGSVDDRGRVSELTTPRALGWAPGTRLRFALADGVVVASVDGPGVCTGTVSAQGYPRLPGSLRRWFGLRPGDRLLLVADLPRARLMLHPPEALEEMISGAHRRLIAETDAR
jgi:bifunctional DNA-binding transcriptional regulator/antitoxin component of YhaV-PrlF toxin-antitoxin module